jgi:Mrp family chromosome partitioning ATPase
VVENMSGFVAPDTGHVYDIFGSGGGLRVAEEKGVPFLGTVLGHQYIALHATVNDTLLRPSCP